MATFRMRPGLRKIDQNPHSSRSLGVRFGARLRATAQDDQLLLEQEILRHHRSHTTGATELRGHDGQVKQGEQEVPHVRVSVGQTSGAAQRCRILDSAREFSIRDATCARVIVSSRKPTSPPALPAHPTRLVMPPRSALRPPSDAAILNTALEQPAPRHRHTRVFQTTHGLSVRCE